MTNINIELAAINKKNYRKSSKRHSIQELSTPRSDFPEETPTQKQAAKDINNNDDSNATLSPKPEDDSKNSKILTPILNKSDASSILSRKSRRSVSFMPDTMSSFEINHHVETMDINKTPNFLMNTFEKSAGISTLAATSASSILRTPEVNFTGLSKNTMESSINLSSHSATLGANTPLRLSIED